MQIKKLLTATLLSLAFFNINSAFAEEKSDTKTNDKSIQEKEIKKKKTTT